MANMPHVLTNPNGSPLRKEAVWLNPGEVIHFDRDLRHAGSPRNHLGYCTVVAVEEDRPRTFNAQGTVVLVLRDADGFEHRRTVLAPAVFAVYSSEVFA